MVGPARSVFPPGNPCSAAVGRTPAQRISTGGDGGGDALLVEADVEVEVDARLLG